jgi:hypothetical protein
MRTRNTTMTAAGPWPAAAVGSPSPQRIRWGAVFGGAVIGIALLALLTTLWFALAYGSGMEQIRDNLEWYVGGSAIACLFVAGLLAGWLSGVNGAGSGFFNGVTIWALMLIIVLSVGIPAVLNVLNLGRVTALEVETGGLLANGEDVLWATFLSILGGLVACGLGGMIGGALTSPANAHLVDDAEDTAVVERTDRDRTVVLDDDDDHADEDETSHVHHRAS